MYHTNTQRGRESERHRDKEREREREKESERYTKREGARETATVRNLKSFQKHAWPTFATYKEQESSWHQLPSVFDDL